MCVQVHIFSIFYLSGNFSTKGSEFHFLIASRSPYTGTEILVSTDESEPVNFWVYWNKRTHPRTQSNTTHTVSRGKSVHIDIPYALSIDRNDPETPTDIGIQLHSQDGKQLTVVQVLRPIELSFGLIFKLVLKFETYLVFPKIETKSKTYEYFALFIPGAEVFGFVTTEPHTTITITPVTNITTFFVIFHSLVRGENYTATVPAAGTSVIGYASEYNSDLSGTRVISDKPLSFFVGNFYVMIFFYVDVANLFQIPPTETWGFKFFIVPLSTRSADDGYRILASRGGTECSVTCTNASLSENITLANPGDFKQLIYTTRYCSVECNHPILIFESHHCGYFKDLKMIPPVGQYSNDYDLYFSDELEGDTVLIKLAIPTEYDPSLLRFDGRPLSGVTFVNVSCSDGEVCGRVATYHPTNASATGSHKLVHEDPDARFIAIAYVCSTRSYGYVGGMKFDSIAGEFGNLLHCLVSK